MLNAERTTYCNEHAKKYNSKFLKIFYKSLKYFNLNLRVFKMICHACDVRVPVTTRHFFKNCNKQKLCFSVHKFNATIRLITFHFVASQFRQKPLNFFAEVAISMTKHIQNQIQQIP